MLILGICRQTRMFWPRVSGWRRKDGLHPCWWLEPERSGGGCNRVQRPVILCARPAVRAVPASGPRFVLIGNHIGVYGFAAPVSDLVYL